MHHHCQDPRLRGPGRGPARATRAPAAGAECFPGSVAHVRGFPMRTLPARVLAHALLGASALLPAALAVAGVPAVVHKATATIHAEPDFGSASLATLEKDASVSVAAQQGLWYRLEPDAAGIAGFVRVNEIRLAQTGVKEADTLQVLLTA